MFSKRVLATCLLISVVGNVALMYRVFDLGVTVSYETDEIRRRNEQVEAAQKLLSLLMRTTSHMDVMVAAKEARLEILDKGEDGIYIEGIRFLFSDNHIVAVDFN